MAKITASITCSNCLLDFQREIQLDARNGLTKEFLINKAIEDGWHVGLIALCPNCKEKNHNSCSNCAEYSNKTMCPPTCEKFDAIVKPNDYCTDFRPLN